MGPSDVHNYKRRFELVIIKIKKSNLSNTTKRLLLEFSDYCVAEGLAVPTIVKHLYNLLNVAKWAGKDLNKTTKKDMLKIVAFLEKSQYAPSVKHATKVSIKKFYKWLNGGQDWPDKVKWIKSAPMGKKRLPEELLSQEEIERMINAAEHIRDKAMISMLYESGFRIGELLSLTLKNIEFDEFGAKVLIPEGKTGMRRVRLVSSSPYLATWMENHPFKNNPDSPLWLSTGTRNKNKMIRYETARNLINILAKKANIKKRIHPHLFRHSAATKLASHFTEAQMNHYFGWVQGSKMTSTYVHLSMRDLEGAVLKLNGLKNDKTESEDQATVKKCPRCSQMNPATGKFCTRCGTPLDMETVLKVEEKRKEVDGVMTALMKDPEVLNLLARKMKEMNISFDAQPSVK